MTGQWADGFKIGSKCFRSPVFPASGTFGFGFEMASYGDLRRIGALVTKSLSVDAWEGNPAPRVAALNEWGSMVNSVGLPNPGVESWASETLPALLEAGVAVVASIWGHVPEDLIDAARKLAKFEGPIAWEVNLSCPNLSTSEAMPSKNPKLAFELTRQIRSVAPSSVAIWCKLAPDATNIVEVARWCAAGGAESVTLCNTFPYAAMFPDRPPPPVGARRGGVSGALLKPIVLEHVRSVKAACPGLSIVAAGGVFDRCDVEDYLDAGASGVEVGTANFLDPRRTFQLAELWDSGAL